MKKRFVVMVDITTEKWNADFHRYLKSIGAGWWHWLSRAWLIVISNPEITICTVRDAATNAFPGSHLLVLELTGGDTWGGFGPGGTKKGQKNMFTWLHNNWKSEDDIPF